MHAVVEGLTVNQLRTDLHPLPDALVAFSGNYEEARRNFCLAADGERLPIDTRRHPLTGPFGELLACDIVWAGPRAARRVLVLVSAVHGVEGFCGSALQTDWLSVGGPGRLPDSCAVMLIHAVNPWGFAWLRRVTEDGVDLNRNFVDFSATLPDDSAYGALADDLVPASMDFSVLARADKQLETCAVGKTGQDMESIISAGQYSHPEGLFYGGAGPTWSRTLLEALVRDYDLAGRAGLCVIDARSGLGPFGYGGLVSSHQPESRPSQIARLWFGASVDPLASSSRHGLSDYFWHSVIGDCGCMLTLEFGTWPWQEIFSALRADHGLHQLNRSISWNDRNTRSIKASVRRAFYPDTPDWQEMVMMRGRQVVRQALAGLADMAV